MATISPKTKKPMTMVTLAKDILKWLEKPSKSPILPRTFVAANRGYLDRDACIQFLNPVLSRMEWDEWTPLLKLEQAFEEGVGVRATKAVSRLHAICRNVIKNEGSFVPYK